MENKKMIVNAATCDIRNITEEVLQTYESICINAAVVISSQKAQELVGRYSNVSVNAANVFTTDEDIKVNVMNGVSEIGPGDTPTEKTVLLVNGKLIIKDCAPELFDNYVSILINGKVMCPKGLSAVISSKAAVNGKLSFYPDGAIILKNYTNIDRIFSLRAKDSLYWAEVLLFLDPALDADALRAKGARFEAKKVVIAESLVEKMIDLISEETDIKVVPDGTEFVKDDAKLSENLINRCGTKLYVNGDLDVKDTAAEALSKLEYVFVNGDVNIYKDYVEQFCSIKPEYDGMNVIDPEKERKYDKILSDKVMLKIDKNTLESFPNGVLVCDCAKLKIAENVPAELILKKLTLKDCAAISCSPEQESAVSFVAEDCGIISANGGEADGEPGIGDMVKSVFGGIKDLINTKMINAAEYRF